MQLPYFLLISLGLHRLPPAAYSTSQKPWWVSWKWKAKRKKLITSLPHLQATPPVSDLRNIGGNENLMLEAVPNIVFQFYFILLYIRFLWVIYFIHVSVYMSIPISQFIPPPPRPPSPPWCPYVCSLHLCLFLPCKPVHLYHFSRFHIYELIYNICFSLSDFTLYDSL